MVPGSTGLGVHLRLYGYVVWARPWTLWLLLCGCLAPELMPGAPFLAQEPLPAGRS